MFLIVDRNIPTLPPTLKPEQQQKLPQALGSGDPDAAHAMQVLQHQGLM